MASAIERSSSAPLNRAALLKLGSYLAHSETEKLAIHLQVDRRHVASLRQQHSDDPELFAYKLLLKWWENTDEEDEEGSRLELVTALRAMGLIKVASMVEGNQPADTSEGCLSDQSIMTRVAGLTHHQAELLALTLGVKRSYVESLKLIYQTDPQLFAFHAIRRWRDGCELGEQEAGRELATAIVTISSRSRRSHDDDMDYRDGRWSRLTQEDHNRIIPPINRGCSHRRCVSFNLIVSLFLILCLTCTAALCVLPITENYTFHYQYGDTFVLPLKLSSFWVQSLVVTTNDNPGLCTGTAVVLPCSLLVPNYTNYNNSDNMMYLAEGSQINFVISPNNSYDQLELSGYKLWVFNDYERYHTVTTHDGFDGYSCRHKLTGEYCIDIDSKHLNLSYPIARRGYYYVACQPEGSRCFNLEYKWNFHRGFYDYRQYSPTRQTFSIASTGSDTITIQKNFHFSFMEQCVLVSMDISLKSRCQGELQLKVSDTVTRKDIIVFPLIGVLICLLLLLSANPLYCISLQLRKKWRRQRMALDEKPLVNVSDV